MRVLKRILKPDKNNSVIYLAQLCLLYLLITSSYLPNSTNTEISANEKSPLFIEILIDGKSTIKVMHDAYELSKLKTEHGLSDQLRSGDKITFNNGGTSVSRINAKKRISLGIPIGINSAGSEDLTAIDGIGEELAKRIIEHRQTYGKFKSIEELDNIEGIGEKKLSTLTRVSNLD